MSLINSRTRTETSEETRTFARMITSLVGSRSNRLVGHTKEKMKTFWYRP